MSDTKGCLIDVISMESALKNRKKLIRASVETVPYVSTLVNTLTGAVTGHACLLFHYKGDTWNYDSLLGSVKVFPMELIWDLTTVAKKVFSLLPNTEVARTIPLEVCTMFKEDNEKMQKLIKNKVAEYKNHAHEDTGQE